MPAARSARGQANLAAVCVALVLVTVVVGVAVAVADDALQSAERDPLERRAAATLADRLVAAERTAFERNVVNRTALAALNGTVVDRLAPTVSGRSVRVRLDGDVVFERGTPADGTTVSRVVRAGTADRTVRRVPLNATGTVTLAARTDRVELTVRPGNRTAVRTVRLNDRVVLHNESGLVGNATVRTSRRSDATLDFAAYGNVTDGNASGETTNRSRLNGTVRVAAHPLNTSAGTLEVTVDD